ncbi:MAG: hypothetical protein PVJ73_17640 [Acidobacteriota bacterium]|jgi:hypothetical protein
MKRYRLFLLLVAGAAVVLTTLVPAARRERETARQEYAAAREERERLRARLADLGRRTYEEDRATAADGVSAARALRHAVIRATDGLAVSGVEISVSVTPRSAVAARGHFAAEGRFTEVLRLARRLADSSSGLLLGRVSLGAARGAVRIEADTFILREGA